MLESKTTTLINFKYFKYMAILSMFVVFGILAYNSANAGSWTGAATSSGYFAPAAPDMMSDPAGWGVTGKYVSSSIYTGYIEAGILSRNDGYANSKNAATDDSYIGSDYTVYTMYDKDYLYIGISVNDDMVIQDDETGLRIDRSDYVEFNVEANNANSHDYVRDLAPPDRKFFGSDWNAHPGLFMAGVTMASTAVDWKTLNVLGAGNPWHTASGSNYLIGDDLEGVQNGWSHSKGLTGTGYFINIKIALATLGQNIQSFGLNVVVKDRDALATDDDNNRTWFAAQYKDWRVGGGFGESVLNNSVTWGLITCPDIRFIVQPNAVIDCYGKTLHNVYCVAKYGDGTIEPTFQWEKDGVNITGATKSVINFGPMAYSMEGVYRCKVDGPGMLKPVYTKEVLVYTIRKDTITHQPKSLSLKEGETAMIEVRAHINDTMPPTYNSKVQWFKILNSITTKLANDDRFAGVTSSIMSIKNVVADDAKATYFVRIYGHCDSVTSVPVSITIILPAGVNIQTQPKNDTLCAGTSATFSVVAVPTGGGTGLTYQWYKDGAKLVDNSDISGSTAAKLVVASLKPVDEGFYEVEITAAPDNTIKMSDKVYLSIKHLPVITKQPPVTLSAKAKDPLKIEIIADGYQPLTYQWYENGTPIASQTTATYTNSSATLSVGTHYLYCKVSNECNSAGLQTDTCEITITQFILEVGSNDGRGYSLGEAHPNPSTGSARIECAIPMTANVKVVLTDILGRELAILTNRTYDAGSLAIDFDSQRLGLSPGVYYYTMISGSYVSTKQLVLIK